MSVNIHVQEACVNVEVVRGEINLGKPPVLLELEVTKDGIYTPEAGVDGFSEVRVQVLPTDMLDGLEDGWDVMFYDEHKRGLASYSIKKGHSINPPVYDCKDWQTADGATVVFPYTPTADVIFYVLNATYADQLYEFYGLDKVLYPYILLFYKSYSLHLYFAQSLTEDSYYKKFTATNLKYKANVYVGTVTDMSVENIIALTMANITSLDSTSSLSTGNAANVTLFTNYNTQLSSSVIRLDE